MDGSAYDWFEVQRDRATLGAANEYLKTEFLDELNTWLHVAARVEANRHRRMPRGARLEHVLCFQEERTVRKT